jgi:hypothetical protein
MDKSRVISFNVLEHFDLFLILRDFVAGMEEFVLFYV